MFGDVLKTFGRNFIVASLAPAALIVIANVLFMATEVLPKPGPAYRNAFGLPEWAILLLALIFLTLGLSQFNIPIIRVYEGYYRLKIGIIGILCMSTAFPWMFFAWSVYLSNLGLKSIFITVFSAGVFLFTVCFSQLGSEIFHRRRYNKTFEKINKMKEENLEQLENEYNFRRNYPPDKTALLPTKLGNIIRSFEDHPYTLYNIDPITGWTRLSAVIPQSYADKIEDAKANFSFMLNLSFVITIIGIEGLLLGVENTTLSLKASMGIMLFCFIFSYVLYMIACSYARDEWGEYVRSAFDLYRFDLLKQIGIFLPPQAISLEEEQNIWDLVQRPMFYVQNPGPQLRFLPKSWESKEVVHLTETAVRLRRIAEKFSLTEAEVSRRSLRAFLLERLDLLDRERKMWFTKIRVSSLEEMNQLIKGGQLEDKDILENLQQINSLSACMEWIGQMLKEL